MSSFFLKLFGETRFVSSIKVFPLSIKSINPIQKYLYITESYVCTQKMFYSKTIKISNIVIIYPQSNPMSSNIRVLTHQDLLYMPHALFSVDYLEKKKTALNLCSF